MKILALDLGKFNTMCCFFDTETRKHDFLNATPQLTATRFHLVSADGELRGIMREGKSQIDPKVVREMELANLLKDARARGDSPDEAQALIEAFDRRLETA